MNTNEEMLTDISAELDKEFGAPGTPNVRSSTKKRMRSTRIVFYRIMHALGMRVEVVKPIV